MKFLVVLGLSWCAFVSSSAFAADLSVTNAGFVPSNIWYSKDPFFAGEKIRIYTIIFNGGPYDLTGKVEFFDNGTSIGKTSFALANGGRVRDLWVDWKATEGKHTITARLADVFADGPNGKQAITLPNSETGKNERTVDLDPIAKEARAKAEADKATQTSTEALNKVGNAVQAVSQVVPAPIKDSVSSGVDVLEAIRVGQAYHFRVAQEGKSKDIDVIKMHEEKTSTTTGKTDTIAGATDSMLNVAEKPFAYVMFAIFVALHYLFEWKILFYGIILYVLYRIIKWIIVKIRS